VAEGRRTDPIPRLAALLEAQGLLDPAHAVRIRAAITAEIDDAVAHAESSPLPAPEDALTDLFVHYPWKE
jgi:acetoin:2,6-dichlorophenolindophenol oxidoreductase subunit alpha